MSTILNALRKVQRDRRNAPETREELEDAILDSGLPDRQRSSSVTWIAVGLIVFLALSGAVVLILAFDDDDASGPIASTKTPGKSVTPTTRAKVQKPIAPANIGVKRADRPPAPPATMPTPEVIAKAAAPGGEPKPVVKLDPEKIARALARKPNAVVPEAVVPAPPVKSAVAPAPNVKPTSKVAATQAKPQVPSPPKAAVVQAKSEAPSPPKAATVKPPTVASKPVTQTLATIEAPPKSKPEPRAPTPPKAALIETKAAATQPKSQAPSPSSTGNPFIDTPVTRVQQAGSAPLVEATPSVAAALFPGVQLTSVRWHPKPERRTIEIGVQGARPVVAHEGDLVEGIKVRRIDPGAVELEMGESRRRLSLGQ